MTKALTATERMERSREATKRVTARELLYAGVLARIWPSYVTEPSKPQPGFPFLLCIESPTGLLVWRLTEDESQGFRWLSCRPNDGRPSEDKDAALYALAMEGWE